MGSKAANTKPLRGFKRIRQGLHNERLTVGILDVRAVRAVQGRVRKLLDNLFLIAFPMERRTENPRDRQLPNSQMEFYLLSHFSRKGIV